MPGHGDYASTGVLLSHGFTGSVESVRPWAQFLNRAGFTVQAPLLPGHGTDWRDLATTPWRAWFSAIEKAYFDLASRCDHVAVGGLSMGGTLALRLAALHPVSAVALVNPVMTAPKIGMHVAGMLKFIAPSTSSIADDICKPGVSEHAYVRTPTASVAELNALLRNTRSLLPRVTAPVLLFRSRVDHVVTEKSVEVIRRSISSQSFSLRRLEKSYHVATLDYDANVIEHQSKLLFSQAGRE